MFPGGNIKKIGELSWNLPVWRPKQDKDLVGDLEIGERRPALKAFLLYIYKYVISIAIWLVLTVLSLCGKFRKV